MVRDVGAAGPFDIIDQTVDELLGKSSPCGPRSYKVRRARALRATCLGPLSVTFDRGRRFQEPDDPVMRARWNIPRRRYPAWFIRPAVRKRYAAETSCGGCFRVECAVVPVFWFQALSRAPRPGGCYLTNRPAPLARVAPPPPPTRLVNSSTLIAKKHGNG